MAFVDLLDVAFVSLWFRKDTRTFNKYDVICGVICSKISKTDLHNLMQMKDIGRYTNII